MAGGRVVPIPYDADKETLRHLFESVNGLLFPGGGTVTGNNTFNENAYFLFNLTLEANDKVYYLIIVYSQVLNIKYINNLGRFFPYLGNLYGLQNVIDLCCRFQYISC